jgi:hypothetical protein
MDIQAMKRTELKRKTPLKSGSPLKKTAFNKPKLKNIIIPAETALTQEVKRTFRTSSLKKASLAGFGRTDAHKAHHNALVQLGCFACKILQLEPTTRLCVHHVDGRRNNSSPTDVSEFLAFCCCDDHHRPSSMVGTEKNNPSVHFNKREFVKQIGTESWCVHESFRLLCRCPPWLSDEEWLSYLAVTNKDQQEEWIVYYEKRTRGYKLHLSKIDL